MRKKYDIELEGQRIGQTEFEFADPPMGVIYGKLNFIDFESPYKLIKEYCLQNDIEINTDYPEDKFINTSIIPELKIFDLNKNVIKGDGAHIIGLEKNGFEIHVLGINSNLMKTEFRHHYIDYYKTD
ncbi:hypothetical protein [Luteirhabdus pelagi]|uniref:hypothetical protein n=1 Tax=Luteirhabdus pelagi TaxID=2792783 RepID=UPI00193A59F6|nr:hypothetical protein [Luteirhabdus pelagi]